MAINLSDNIKVSAPKPIESRYLNINEPWGSVSEVNSYIPEGERHIGLTVYIVNAEYWYKDGVGDGDLILKLGGSGDAITGATNGVSISDSNVVLGGTLSNDVVIDGNSGTYDLSLIGLDSVNLEFNTSSIITDNSINPAGIQYAGDYSTTFVANSLVNKAYVDAVASGLLPHEAVVVATTVADGNIDLTGETFISGNTIDGIPVYDGYRVLIKNQTNPAENGIYVYSAETSGFTRSEDYDGTPTGEIHSGDLIPVLTGVSNYNTIWVMTTPEPVGGVIVDVTPLNYTLFTSVTSVSAGIGLEFTTPTELSLDAMARSVRLNAITGSTNGLTDNGRIVELGGEITKPTIIEIIGNSPIASLSIVASGSSVNTIFHQDVQGIYLLEDSVCQSCIELLYGSGITMSSGTFPSGNTELSIGAGTLDVCFNSTAIICDSNPLPRGLQYGDNYNSMCFCDSSLITKFYVDNAITGVSANTIYNGTSPATCTVGGITPGYILAGKTFECILQDAIAPYVPPTFSTFSNNITTPVEVGCTISGSQSFTWGFTNISNVCANTMCVRDITSGVTLATNISITSPQSVSICTRTFTCCGQTHQWCGSAKNTNSIQFNSSIRTICAYLPYYWGKCTCPGPAGANRPTASDVRSAITGGTGNKVLNTSTGTISITFSSGADDYLWFAIPSSVTDKVCWCVPSLSVGGPIGGGVGAGCNLFPSVVIDGTCETPITTTCWSGCCYDIYVSNKQSQVANLMCIF